MTGDVVVEHELTFVRGGRSVRGKVAIGTPYVVDECESRCRIEIDAPGVLERRQDIAGGDRLQALLLGVRFMSRTLNDFLSAGGQLLDDDGSEFPIDAYFGELGLAVR